MTLTSTPETAARPVVLIAEELSPATVEALGPDFEIRYCNGADRVELLDAIADAEAVLVRSATSSTPRRCSPPSGSRWSPVPASGWTTST